MKAVFRSAEQVAQDTWTFWFAPERPVHYTAGQFTELFLPHQADTRGTRRWFTLSSSPTETLLGITTRITPGGSSFKQHLRALQPGTTVDLAEPMGDFVLPKDPSIPLVFIAAGLGITPVRSMVKWLLDTGERRNLQLIYTTHQPTERAFLPVFDKYGLRPSFTKPTITSLYDVAQQTPDALLYLSGPEDFVESSVKTLGTKGIAPYRLVGDYFPGYRNP